MFSAIVMMVIHGYNGGLYVEYVNKERCEEIRHYFEKEGGAWLHPRVDCIILDGEINAQPKK